MPKSPSLHEPLHESLRSATAQDFDAMSDEEILRYLGNQTEGDRFAIPRGLEPDGMKYQWMSAEVLGKPNSRRMAEVAMGGWNAVPQQRHDGMFMAYGSEGPIVVDGMMLFEIPERVYRLKRELASRLARDKVRSMNAQLAYAPPGTAPRDAHRETVPFVKREAGATEMVVE